MNTVTYLPLSESVSLIKQKCVLFQLFNVCSAQLDALWRVSTSNSEHKHISMSSTAAASGTPELFIVAPKAFASDVSASALTWKLERLATFRNMPLAVVVVKLVRVCVLRSNECLLAHERSSN